MHYAIFSVNLFTVVLFHRFRYSPKLQGWAYNEDPVNLRFHLEHLSPEGQIQANYGNLYPVSANSVDYQD